MNDTKPEDPDAALLNEIADLKQQMDSGKLDDEAMRKTGFRVCELTNQLFARRKARKKKQKG